MFRSVVPGAAIAEYVLSGCADSIPSMTAEFDVGREVAASLGSRQGAWRFIRRYAESWLTPLSDGDGWEPFLERFSLACVEMVLSESLFSAPLELSDNCELDPTAATLVEQRFARLAIPDYPMWALPGASVHWLTGPDLLLRHDGGTWLWVRARTTAALDAVRSTLPGEWLMLPDG